MVVRSVCVCAHERSCGRNRKRVKGILLYFGGRCGWPGRRVFGGNFEGGGKCGTRMEQRGKAISS